MTGVADSFIRPQAIVLGASAGAVEALSTLLPPLPADYPIPILAVVHTPPEKRNSLADLFRAKCRVKVKEAEDKEPVRGGTVYFAPPNYHLLVETDRRLSLSTDEPVLFCRPAIDVLFVSAADAFGRDLVGIVLTGANADGARGLATVCEAGGMGIVQNPEHALVPTMPRAAFEACRAAKSMTLDEIAEFLQSLKPAVSK